MPNPAAPRIHVADDALFDQHRSRGHHPERPERLAAVRRALDRCAAEGIVLDRLPARDASDEDLARAHAPDYIAAIAKLAGHHAALDADTYLAPGSIAAARRAAGATIAMVEAMLAGGSAGGSGETGRAAAPGEAEPRGAAAQAEAETGRSATQAEAETGRSATQAEAEPRRSAAPIGVALVRPPGHHATRDRGMGFCIFNNAAVAACWALEHGISRVAIVDWDVHHGNGTQDIFWRDPRVLYVSLHEVPLYPGTGRATETGEGPGAGSTVNVPLSSGATDAVYRLAFDEVVLPALRRFSPELVLVSAGFDAHERDPLASMRVTDAGYGMMAAALAEVAREHARGRIGLVLEGGYDLTALEGSLAAAVRAVAFEGEGAGGRAGAGAGAGVGAGGVAGAGGTEGAGGGRAGSGAGAAEEARSAGDRAVSAAHREEVAAARAAAGL